MSHHSQAGSRRARVVLLLAAASSLFLLSCSRQVQTAAPRHPDPRFLPLPPASRDADDVGRFLAGLPGTPGSPFTDLEQEEAWRVHRAELDGAGSPPACCRVCASSRLGSWAVRASAGHWFSIPSAGRTR